MSRVRTDQSDRFHPIGRFDHGESPLCKRFRSGKPEKIVVLHNQDGPIVINFLLFHLGGAADKLLARVTEKSLGLRVSGPLEGGILPECTPFREMRFVLSSESHLRRRLLMPLAHSG